MATFNHSVFNLEYAKGDVKSRTRTVGLELEVVVKNSLSELYRGNRYGRDADGYRYTIQLEDALKQSDIKDVIAGAGSDGNDAEFVTHPDSITLYNKGGSARLKKAMRWLKQNTLCGAQAPNSGTHVNVGRLQTDNVDEIVDNAYWIMMNFATQIQKIAGRISHWAEFHPYRETDAIFVTNPLIPCTSLKRMKKPDNQPHKPMSGDKGTCLVKKKYTYEFRVFKSTNNLNEVLAWAQLCNNIINLAKVYNAGTIISFMDLIQGKYISKYVKTLKGQRKITEIEAIATTENTLSFQSLTSGRTIIL